MTLTRVRAARARRLRCGAILCTALALSVGGCGSDATGPTAIGPSGGTVEAAGGDVRLVFPPGAVSTDLIIVIRPATTFPADARVVRGSVYEFEPEGIQFARPVELTIKYDPATVPPQLPETTLKLATVSGQRWEQVAESGVNVDAAMVTGFIVQFSVYGPMGRIHGDLQVTASSTGPDLDPDGYAVTLDGSESQPLALDDTMTFTDLTAGDHTVELSGVAENCSVSGENPRTMTVLAGDTVRTTFAVTCSALIGNLDVTAATTGPDPDPDGYTVTVDGTLNQSVTTNGSVSFLDLAAGDHTVQLSGVAANCTVGGSNPRTVTVPFNATATTTFAVTCTALIGNLDAAATTTGPDPDPDGYTITVDGTTSQPLGGNGTVTFTGLAAGDHSVALTGVANNCTVGGTNPRTVTVPFNGTATTTFAVTCTALIGNLDVTAATTGPDPDPDGYTVTIDGTQSQPLGVNGTVTFTGLAVGDHSVEFTGVAANCAVGGVNPRTVSVPLNGTATTTFDVTCTALTGNLQVSTATTGPDPDPDGYTVTVDGTQNQAIAVSGTVTFSGLAVGDHTVELTGVAANCTVGDPNPRAVTVPANGTATTSFAVACTALTGDLRVTTATTGPDPDPDGYTVTVDGTTSQPLGVNSTVSFTGLAVGDHSVELTGVATNCTVGGSNPRTVTVAFNSTTSTTFAVSCTASTSQIALYDVFEASFEAASSYSNPYLQGSMTAAFRAPSGQTVTLEGFWDGGSTWRVRMTPTEVGTWTYTTSSDDPGLDGKSGSFQAVSSANRGHIRVSLSNPHTFEHADGTPFFWLADTNWDLFNLSTPFDGTFQSYVDTRVSQEFTMLQAVLEPTQAGGAGAPRYSGENEGGLIFHGNDFTNEDFNPAYFQWMDKRVEYLMGRGLALAFWFSWADDWTRGFSGAPYQRFARYLIARYTAYNVFWGVIGEYEEIGNNQAIRDNGALIKATDPYDHPLTTHTVNRTSDSFASESWIDFHGHQSWSTNVASYNQAAVNDRQHNRPTVHQEIGYEAELAGEIYRKGGWAFFTGGGFFTYGHRRIAWDKPANWSSDPQSAGAAQMTHYRNFVNRLQWWLMEPNNDLVNNGFCLTRPGQEYVVYLPSGGSVTVDLSSATGNLQAEWFNPRTGATTPIGPVSGGAPAAFTAPDTNDWTLYVRP